MKDIENGRYVGIISDLTLNELRKVIRNQLVRKGVTDTNDWNSKEAEAITRIFQIKIDNMEIVSSDFSNNNIKNNELFSKISGKAYALMVKYPGKVIIINHKNKHKGLSTVDTFHIVLAQSFNCCKIASFDKDFKNLSEISQLAVKQEYSLHD